MIDRILSPSNRAAVRSADVRPLCDLARVDGGRRHLGRAVPRLPGPELHARPRSSGRRPRPGGVALQAGGRELALNTRCPARARIPSDIVRATPALL